MRPPVFGYVRSTVPEEAKVNILLGELVLHAGRRGLELVDVFQDVPCSGLALERAGFTRLLAAVTDHGQAGVLLPTRCHLSWRAAIRQSLERRILDTGARLHVLWSNGDRTELWP